MILVNARVNNDFTIQVQIAVTFNEFKSSAQVAECYDIKRHNYRLEYHWYGISSRESSCLVLEDVDFDLSFSVYPFQAYSQLLVHILKF